MSQFLKIKTSPALTPYYSLKSTGICSTSHLKYYPRGPPQATHASAWRKWEKWVPKLIRMIGFRRNFEFFPEASGELVWVFYDVFWCPGALGTFLEWFWIDLGSLIFSWFFLKILSHKSNVGRSVHPPKKNRFEHWWCQSKLK